MLCFSSSHLDCVVFVRFLHFTHFNLTVQHLLSLFPLQGYYLLRAAFADV